MRTPDMRVFAATVFCCLAALEIGCDGDSSSQVDAVPSTTANVTFRFKNTGARALYLHSGCWATVRVISIAKGTAYDNGAICACECASSSCEAQMACGTCPPPFSGEPIAAEATKEIIWRAHSTTTQTKNGSHGVFQCLDHSPIPTGEYRVEIDLYASPSDADAKTNPLTFAKAFTLASEDATVEVPIQ